MFTALVILIAIISVLLVLVVLIQNSKGGGLSSEFSGPGSAQMFSVKKTTDLVEQVTWGFALAIIVLSLGSYVLVSGGQQRSGVNSVNIEKAAQTTLPNTVPAPAATTTATPPADSAK